MPDYFIDDTDEGISYHGSWNHLSDVSLMGGSVMDSSAGTLNVSFNGGSIQIFGYFLTGNKDPSFIIDGQSVKPGPFPIASTPTIQLLYQTIIGNGDHTITMSGYNGWLDYIVFASQTPMIRQRAIVDDGSSEVSYQGTWTRDTALLDGTGGRSAVPYGGGTHSTSSVGSSARFTFTGTTVSVYGRLARTNSQSSGNVLEVTYTLDGSNFTKNYNADTYVPHFKWFEATNLLAEEHTLTMVLTKYGGAVLNLNYILHSMYSAPGGASQPDTALPFQTTGTPSPSLVIQPQSNTLTANELSGMTSVSSGSSGALEIATNSPSLSLLTATSTNSFGQEITVTFVSQPSQSFSIGTSPQRTPPKLPLIGALVGGILALLAIIIFLLLLRRARKRRRLMSSPVSEVEPFNVQPDLSRLDINHLPYSPVSKTQSPLQEYHKSPMEDAMSTSDTVYPSTASRDSYDQIDQRSAARIQRLENLVIGLQQKIITQSPPETNNNGGRIDVNGFRSPPPYSQTL